MREGKKDRERERERYKIANPKQKEVSMTLRILGSS